MQAFKLTATTEYLTTHTKESTMLISRRAEDIPLLDTIYFILNWEKFTAALFLMNRREKPEVSTQARKNHVELKMSWSED